VNKILIFDAYPFGRELLAEELADEGNFVIAIGNPESLTEIVGSFEPDLLIMDPYIRGTMQWEVFDKAKAINPRLPVLLFTQSSFPDERFARANAWVTKSYIFDNLKRGIKEIMAGRGLDNGSSAAIPPKESPGAVP
jgi:CheY-like chemotaxis protein